MPISAPGSRARRPRRGRPLPLGGRGAKRGGCAVVHAKREAGRAAGFTLIELIVVIAIIAITTAIASLALRDPTTAKLEQEAVRLAALLESARAEARASGLAARWEPVEKQSDGSGFRFIGLPSTDPLPTHWLDAATGAQVIGARAVVLGPEPLIGEQRIVLRLDDRRLTLATDGIGPFLVAESGAVPP